MWISVAEGSYSREEQLNDLSPHYQYNPLSAFVGILKNIPSSVHCGT